MSIKSAIGKYILKAVGDWQRINNQWVQIISSTAGGYSKTTINYLDSYAATASVYQAIQARIDGFLKTKLKIYNPAGKIINDRPEFELIWQPNPLQDYSDFWTAFILSLDLTGKVFIWKMPEIEGVRTTAFKILNPDKCNIKPGKTQYIDYVEYMLNNQRINIPPEQIIYYRNIDPRSDYDGLSPLSAIASNILTENSAISYGLSFFRQGVSPGAIFINSTPNLSEPAFERAVEKLEEKYRGEINFHKFIALGGDWDVKSLGIPPKDMEFLQSRKWTKTEIGAIFRVPPSKMGIWDSSSVIANSEVMDLAFWEDSIDPLTKKIDSVLESEILPLLTNEKVSCEFKYPSVKALQYIELKKRDDFERGVNLGVISRDEMRENYYNLPPLNLPYTKVPLIPFGMTPADEEPVESELQFADLNDDDILKAPSALSALKKFRSPYENYFLKKMKSLFRQQERIVLAKFDNAKADILRVVNAQAIFDMEFWEKAFENEYEPFIRKLIIDSAKMTLIKWNLSGKVELTLPYVQQALGMRMREFSKIQKTTIDAISNQLRIGNENKESIAELRGRVKSVFIEATESRANMIAVTETTFGQNTGMYSAMKESKVSGKTWLTSRDDSVRAAHQQMESVTVSIDMPFSVTDPISGNSEQLEFPGTGSAAWNNINCRCAIVPAAAGILEL